MDFVTLDSLAAPFLPQARRAQAHLSASGSGSHTLLSCPREPVDGNESVKQEYQFLFSLFVSILYKLLHSNSRSQEIHC